MWQCSNLTRWVAECMWTGLVPRSWCSVFCMKERVLKLRLLQLVEMVPETIPRAVPAAPLLLPWRTWKCPIELNGDLDDVKIKLSIPSRSSKEKTLLSESETTQGTHLPLRNGRKKEGGFVSEPLDWKNSSRPHGILCVSSTISEGGEDLQLFSFS